MHPTCLKYVGLVALCVVFAVAGHGAPAAEAPASSAARIEQNLAMLVELIGKTTDPSAQADLLRGIAAGLEGRRSAAMPAGWPELYGTLAQSKHDQVRQFAQKLAVTFGDPRALDDVRKAVGDPSQPAELRRAGLQMLRERQDPSLGDLLRALLTDAALSEPAAAGLAAFDDPRTPAAILEHYTTFDAATRRAALNTLSFRLSFAGLLPQAVKEGKIPKGDFTAYTIRQLRTLKNKDLSAWVDATWGVVKATQGQKLKDIEKYKAMLTGPALAGANLSAGRGIFAKTCGQCHVLYGVGGKVGPDITGSSRQDIDYLLVNIIDPSSVIARDFQVTNIWTKDDQVLSGIVSREDENSLTLVTESTSTTVQRSEIDQLKKSDMSMMPEGLLLPLSPADVVNLVAYLRGTGQVPLPATAPTTAPSAVPTKTAGK